MGDLGKGGGGRGWENSDALLDKGNEASFMSSLNLFSRDGLLLLLLLLAVVVVVVVVVLLIL